MPLRRCSSDSAEKKEARAREFWVGGFFFRASPGKLREVVLRARVGLGSGLYFGEGVIFAE